MSLAPAEKPQYIPVVQPGLLQELADASDLRKGTWCVNFVRSQHELARHCATMITDLGSGGPEDFQAEATELALIYQAIRTTVARTPKDKLAMPRELPVVERLLPQHIWHIRRVGDGADPLVVLREGLETRQPHIADYLQRYIAAKELSPDVTTPLMAPTALTYDCLERQIGIDLLAQDLSDIQWPAT